MLVSRHTGFTLVEVLVSTAIFSVVMVIALGALLSLAEANRKAQTLSVAINNMSAALDSMSRAIRTGVAYHCGSSGSISTQDCTTTAETYFSFQAADGSHVAYCLLGTAIMREIKNSGANSACNSNNFVALTPPNVTITKLQFYVVGSTKGDAIQPKVTILLSGSVPVSVKQTSVFNIQTTVTQRIYDQ